MNHNVVQNAEDYLAFHELDLQNSNDLCGTKVIETDISNEAVRTARMTLGLSLELMAILLGVNLAAMIRYENISLPPYPQGNVSRKMGHLICWLSDPKSRDEILALIAKDNGLATLSGLLQSESVVTFMSLASLNRDSETDERNENYSTRNRVMGNA
jgi:hypothetical protein